MISSPRKKLRTRTRRQREGIEHTYLGKKFTQEKAQDEDEKTERRNRAYLPR